MPGLLTITAEPLTERMAGPAIRALELSRVVAGHLPVTLVSLASCERTDPRVRLLAARGDELRALVATAGCLLIQGDVLGLEPWLGSVDIPLVVDVYDPFHLEQLEQARPLGEARRQAVVRDCVRALNVQLSRADLVLVASGRQRDLWLGHLAALGRVNPVTYDDSADLSRLVAVVPFGTSAEVPDTRFDLQVRPHLRGVLPGIDDDSVIALWAGGLYDWFDPQLVVRAVARAHAVDPRLRLVLLGGGHPVLSGGPAAAPSDRGPAAALSDRGPAAALSERGPAAALSERGRTAQQVARLAETLGLLGTVVHLVDSWVPYDERGQWLAEADLGVVAHRAGVETDFAFRTRLLDHLWAGLPTVGTGGDVLTDRIAEAGAGTAVPPGDEEAFAAALLEYAGSTQRRQHAVDRARELATRYAWAAVAAPLVEFCRAPRRSPDLVLPATERALLGIWEPMRRSLFRRLLVLWQEGGAGLLRQRVLARISRSRRWPNRSTGRP